MKAMATLAGPGTLRTPLSHCCTARTVHSRAVASCCGVRPSRSRAARTSAGCTAALRLGGCDHDAIQQRAVRILDRVGREAAW